MRDVLGPGTILGYCTNVHAGADFAQTQANLRRYLPAVKAKASPAAPMGVGLWFSASAAAALEGSEHSSPLPELGTWLREEGLLPFTLNGFPYGDFHEPVVKHRVYKPDWDQPERADYTRQLAAIAALLSTFQPAPPDALSISTLPLGWPGLRHADPSGLDLTVCHLVALAEALAMLSDSAGLVIHVDLEPEPGCLLQRAGDVVCFFEERLLPFARRAQTAEDLIRRHLRVCHDICHSAVMFEDQGEALRTYQAAGIQVGKVQISSALRVPFHEMDVPQREQAFAAVKAFNEPRYLHQTVVRDPLGRTRFYEDLPQAIAAIPPRQLPDEEWRIHFHVPLFLERSGLLQTTQGQVMPAVRLAAATGTKHFEVETYAWGVLPDELRQADLADGIAQELRWVAAQAGGQGAMR